MKKFFFLFAFLFLLHSCARVGSPVGGSKDTIPPKVVGSNIDSSRVNVAKNLKELRIDFDEYVKLKDINKNLIISPPIKKIKRIIPSNLPAKFISIQWEDSLKANTTYSFNFGNSIMDNNEGNVLPYYNFAFSTGEKLDDVYISGTIKNGFLQRKNSADKKDKNIVVGLYQDKDSMDYRQKPYYISKVDDDGYYELNYLSLGNYRIIAFNDENGNSVYDEGKEDVGFFKEKIALEKSISGLNIKLFPSKKKVKYVEMKEMEGGILMNFEGEPDEVKVLSLNEKIKDYKVTHQKRSDSVQIWFDAKKQEVGTANSENLKFSYDADIKKDTVSIFYKFNPKNEMSISNKAGNLLAPNSSFKITSNYTVENIQPEKWTLVSDSIKQDFTAQISKNNANEIIIKSDFKQGKKYQLTIPKETVASFYANISKSYRFDFEADKIENYGKFTLKLTSKPEAKFWVQLLNDKEEVAYSKFSDSSEISFDVLKPGDYLLRILVDNDGNGFWDKADFAKQIFAEDVYFFKKTVSIKPLWEIVEEWDLKSDSDFPPEKTK